MVTNKHSKYCMVGASHEEENRKSIAHKIIMVIKKVISAFGDYNVEHYLTKNIDNDKIY